MSKEEYMDLFREGKENLKQGNPPDHWNEKKEKLMEN